MLQRAASNAYSWWWASHIRTKQSKWLEESLQDIEDKVRCTLKIIDDDGDSFAKRAEMYYKKRPELKALVEEFFRAYRSLAERYDHLSRDFQSANRKLATAFPEEVQFEEDEYEDEGRFAGPSRSLEKPSKSPPQEKKGKIPKVPKFPKDFKASMFSRKRPLKQNLSSAKSSIAASSGLTKAEALEEIDRLQKEILSLQTEKEFVKSSYEQGYERYWAIENEIVDMQGTVCKLQDEFGIGTVIEDNDARTLMAATALKSCKEALSKLEEQREQSVEEARAEQERIAEVQERFVSLGGEFLPEDKIDQEKAEEEHSGYTSPEMSSSVRRDGENSSLDMKSENIKKEPDLDSKASLTMSELADKVNELVEKVLNLETAVSSQNSLVTRLRSETDQLHSQVRTLEEEKETLIIGSDNMNNRLKELEKELHRLKALKQNFRDHNRNLISHFTEANSNLDHLSKNLQNVKMDEEVENSALLFQEVRTETNHGQEKEETKDNGHTPDEASKAAEEIFVDSGPGSEFDALSEKPQESVHNDKEENQDLYIEPQDFSDAAEDQPSWRQLFLNGVEDREKVLLDEYSSMLRSYKQLKRKLGEVEKDNRDGLFELALQIRQLKNENELKDEEIRALRLQLGTPNEEASASQKMHENQEKPSETKESSTSVGSSSQDAGISSPPKEKQPLYKLLLQHDFKGFMKNYSRRDGETRVGKGRAVLTAAEKFRSEIDELLEENLDFWLRFSTSIHQVQKFQTTFHDLQAELAHLMKEKKQDGSIKGQSLSSEARPLYKHLREIQTELKLWLEHSTLLKDELDSRSSALVRIQDDITRVSDPGSAARDPSLSEYQAAKFQGEVLNMKQENKKVAEELKTGLERVKKLQAEIDKTLAKLDEHLGVSGSKRPGSSGRSKIPLRSFLFGVKLKKKQTSIFACVSPAMQKHHSDAPMLTLE